MELTCQGILVEWTVSGRAGHGTMYPKLQIWRRSTLDSSQYTKIGPEIQIDAEGSACENISQVCSQTFHCTLLPSYQVEVRSGIDIIGVELPPLDNQGFELYFIESSQRQYVFRREVNTSTISTESNDVVVLDDILLSVDVLTGENKLISGFLLGEGRE